jgi:hypothetical protein
MVMSPAMHPDKVDVTTALHVASLVDAYKAHSIRPLPQNPRPRAPDTALPRVCINTSLAVVALRLAGHINPSRTADSGTCNPATADAAVLAMFAVATSLTHLWMFCQVILLARLLPIPALIPLVPGATPT